MLQYMPIQYVRVQLTKPLHSSMSISVQSTLRLFVRAAPISTLAHHANNGALHQTEATFRAEQVRPQNSPDTAGCNLVSALCSQSEAV
jgi:hypothetical protein